MSILNRLVLGTMMMSAANASFALAFNINPQQTLPTTVTQGSTSTAYYTVQNNTLSVRNNNFVKWFPPNSVQDTSTDGSETFPVCAATFNLSAFNTPGDRCTLKLTVTGEISATDPDPHHHLFVCFPGRQTCAGTLYPLNVTVNPIPPVPQLVTGYFIASPPDYRATPVFYKGFGTSWTPSTVVENPPDHTLGDELSTVQGMCLAGTCYGVGTYQPSGGGRNPMIEVNNGGSTWALATNITLPPSVGSSGLSSLGCTNTDCSAVGWYQTVGIDLYPLLLTGSGNTWTSYIPSGGELPGDFVKMYSRAPNVSCNSTSCVFVGSYTIGGNVPQPFLLKRTGASWAYPVGNITFPPGMTRGELQAVECNESLCVAAGYYETAVSNFPLIETSLPNSNIWTFRPVTLPPGVTGSAYVNAVTCNSSTCYVGGGYVDGVTGDVPMILAGGLTGTWTAETIVTPTAPYIFKSGFLSAISCSDSICLAVGQFNELISDNVVFLMLTKVGATWSQPIINYPSDFNSVSGFGTRNGLLGANCVGNSCIAVGSYVNPSTQTPIILYGSTSYSKVNPNPVDFDSFGVLAGTDSTNNTALLPPGGA